MSPLDPESGELYGVSRIVADPDYTHAEYAVIVRTDLQARGIGWALMEQLLAYARSEQLSLVEGEVLSENSEMLLMCREMGFTRPSRSGRSRLLQGEYRPREADRDSRGTIGHAIKGRRADARRPLRLAQKLPGLGAGAD